MPETRTFDEGDLDPIAKAVREALGETIRPVQPGAPSARTTPTPAPASTTAPVPRTTPLATFTFRAAPSKRSSPGPVPGSREEDAES